MVIIAIAATLLVISATALLIDRHKQRQAINAGIKREKKKTKNTVNVLLFFTALFRKTPLVKKRYQKIYNRIYNLTPQEPVAMDLAATRKLLLQYIIAIIFGAMVLVTSGGDVFFIAAGILMIYLMLDYVTNTSSENTEKKILEQTRLFVTQVIANYNKCGMVDDAVRMTLDDNPEEIAPHAEMIYKVLTSTNIKAATDEYVDKAPNKFLMLFMAICSSVQEYGDKRIGIGGAESMFIKNLTYLTDEISNAIDLQNENDALFKNLPWMCVLPILAIKPIEAWAIGNMPETQSFYNGMYGALTTVGLFVISIICYNLITSLRATKNAVIKEESIFMRIARIPVVSTIINAYNRNHYTRSQRLNDDLLLTHDRTGVNAFYVKRVVIAIVGVIVTIFVFETSILREKANMFSNFAESYESTFTPNENYRQTMIETSQNLSGSYRSINAKEIDRDALIREIETTTTITNPSYSQLVADTVINTISQYQNAYFKWYHLLIAYIVGVAAFFAPVLILRFKIQQTKKDMTDEISQFHTLALILMYVDGMTLEQVLEWMDRFSYCFRYRIEQCMIDLPRGEQKALERMQEGPNKQFNQFVDNLENIDNVGVQQAFANIEGDRQYFKLLRERENKESIRSKSRIGTLVAFTPLMGTAFFQMIMPMLMMTFEMLTQLYSAVGS